MHDSAQAFYRIGLTFQKLVVVIALFVIDGVNAVLAIYSSWPIWSRSLVVTAMLVANRSMATRAKLVVDSPWSRL